MEHFGQRLRKLRGDRSQKEVAVGMGIPQTTLSTLENQESVPRGEVVRKFAEYYRVPVKYFYEGQASGLVRSEAASAWLRSLPHLRGKDTIATHAAIPIDEKTRKKIAGVLRKKYADTSNE